MVSHPISIYLNNSLDINLEFKNSVTGLPIVNYTSYMQISSTISGPILLEVTGSTLTDEGLSTIFIPKNNELKAGIYVYEIDLVNLYEYLTIIQDKFTILPGF